MKNKFTTEVSADFLCIFLIVLLFISKLSFKWMKVIPYSFPPIIFQYGIHPYINFGIQFIISIVLFYIWVRKKNTYPMSPMYKLYIYALMALLSIQTLFQITLVNIDKSPLIQLAGLGMAIMLILVYGIIIPSLFSLDKFIFWMTRVGVFLVVTSFLSLALFYTDMFKGGRFIGLFKHIPHMVSASTASFIFFFPNIFSEKRWTLKKNNILKIIILFILFLSVLLTSTKAAIGTIVITVFIGIFIFGTKKRSIHLFKLSFILCTLISILLIGAPAYNLVYEITTGKTSFGMRKAQDGVETRMEEVTRGWEQFEKSPYFGLGLLYKFLNNKQDGIEVEGYNSFKDPHNLFVSAATIGGSPLLVFAIIAYLLMIMAAIKGMIQNDPNKKIIGLFLLSHLPVFVIYHAHFSLGGMADRIYWLIFGYLGQQWATNKKVLINHVEVI